MINIQKAQGNQTTRNGVNEDWIVTLDEEEIYKLPAHFTVQETFMIRDIKKDMINRVVADEKLACDERVADIVKNGDAVVQLLKDENLRISTALEQHLST